MITLWLEGYKSLYNFCSHSVFQKTCFPISEKKIYLNNHTYLILFEFFFSPVIEAFFLIHTNLREKERDKNSTFEIY